MPAAMESSPNPPKTLKILWKSLYFLQISSNFFFWKSEVGWEGGAESYCTDILICSATGGPPAESYCTDILICSATLHSLWGPQPERVLQ